MRQVKGAYFKFDLPKEKLFFGRVTATKNTSQEVSYLVQTDIKNPQYLVLFPGDGQNTETPYVELSKEFELKTGDILRFSQNGLISLVIEANSSDNALFLTDACNLSCVMCPQPPQQHCESFLNEAFRIVDLIDEKSIDVLGITGGEPTVFFEDLICLIKTIRNKLPNCFIHILTNGTVFKSHEKAKEIVASTEGKALFCIPLYSDDETAHNRLVQKETFWDTLTGLHNLGKEKALIELRTVILKQNWQRLEEYALYIYRTLPFISHAAFMGLEPIGFARKNFDELWIQPNQYMQKLNNAVLKLHMRGINVSVYNHPHCILPQSLWEFSAPSISNWKKRYLDKCQLCKFHDECGGMFFSALKHLQPLIKSLDSPISCLDV